MADKPVSIPCKTAWHSCPDDVEGVVGVHDGVRPFPSLEVIHNCYEAARTAKAVIPVIPVVETVRQFQ